MVSYDVIMKTRMALQCSHIDFQILTATIVPVIIRKVVLLHFDDCTSYTLYVT